MIMINKDSVTVSESSYTQTFDESNRHWERRPEYNLLFLKSQENYLNDLLISRGHIFLNEVYDCLGFKRTSSGALVGWVLDGQSDSYIDFGIQDFQKESTPSVQLNFNVDGIIYDKI